MAFASDWFGPSPDVSALAQIEGEATSLPLHTTMCARRFLWLATEVKKQQTIMVVLIVVLILTNVLDLKSVVHILLTGNPSG
jgi:hypothetical protein